jgi:glucokinase
MRYAIGIDIGATNVKTVVVTPAGEILASERFATEGVGDGWLGLITDFVSQIEMQQGDARCIGIAAPGLAATDRRSIAWMQGRLAQVQDLDWTKHLNRHKTVPIMNDAHAALLGEMWLGAAIGQRNVALLTLGTGVGGAIVCDGRLLRGHLGRAGHFGHISLNPDGPPDIVQTPGSLEDAIGDHTVLLRSAGRFASTEALVAAHLRGDENASQIWIRSIKVLAAGIVSIVNTVDPESVILGGGIARAGTALFDPLAKFLAQFEWRPHGQQVRVVPAVLGDGAGSLGAARHAMMLDKEESA